MAHREIREFDYVNQGYAKVRDALKKEASSIFQRATKLAEERSGALVAALSAEVAGVKLSRDITLRVGDIREEKAGTSELSRTTRVPLAWQAAESERAREICGASDQDDCGNPTNISRREPRLGSCRSAMAWRMSRMRARRDPQRVPG